MTIDDVRDACDIFLSIYESTDGRDGRVSIEVDPRISEDREATLSQARELWRKVDRPNVMIKIPATPESIPAITDALSEGISVNVTLIFSVARYREVIAAYREGIQRAAEKGTDVSTIHSVASFFRLRVSTSRSIAVSRRSAPRRPRPCAARRVWPTPSAPTPCSRTSVRKTCRRVPTCSARCGRRPA